MIKPRKPDNEDQRLDSLHSLAVLDTPAEERFDRITRVAQRAFDVPIALVSLVDEDRQWFKSNQGLDAASTTREVSFCGHTILEAAPLIVEDATLDERFRDNPLVRGYPHVRFYAGYPLRDAEHQRLGTLCLIDHKPRKLARAGMFEAEQLFDSLRRKVEAELATPTPDFGIFSLLSDRHFKRGLGYDSGTKLWNATGFSVILNRAIAQARFSRLPISVLAARFEDHGLRDPGCAREVPALLKSRLRSMDPIARSGEWFMALLVGTDAREARLVASELASSSVSHPVLEQRGAVLRVGTSTLKPGVATSAERLIRSAQRNRVYNESAFLPLPEQHWLT